ncbi:MAG: lipopolysaccharide/colanic/teichoic acid biosynthesis glycosyltransferase, partial [Halioglobus sp.]
PFSKQVLMDIEYIRKRSLWMDIKLLLRTLPAVFLARGAY